MKRRAAVAVAVGLAGLVFVIRTGGGRHEVTADIVADTFRGFGAGLCVDGAFVPARWIPEYEVVYGTNPPNPPQVRATDGSGGASVGDRADVVIERRRLPPGHGVGHPFQVAQVIELREVVAGGALDLDCGDGDGDGGTLITEDDDEWWDSLP